MRDSAKNMSAVKFTSTSGARSSHLAFALLWLPRQRRRDALLFYKFCRTIDDIADKPDRTNLQKQQLLQEWLDAIPQELPPEFESIVRRYDIDRSLLTEIVHGCEMDISQGRYATISDLEKYCWRVAGAVGLVSIKIFGCHDLQSREYAENLGQALQLTNILRDIAEDARMGRIYLPLEDLEHFGVNEKDLLGGHPGEGFLPLMRFEAERARDRFAKAILPLADSQTLIPAEIMRAVYLKILGRLERTNFPVFEQRIRLGQISKITTALRAMLRVNFAAFKMRRIQNSNT